MGKFFGTDGIRGLANDDLTCELAMKVGRATAFILLKNIKTTPTVFIGKDTRVSSDMLENALAAGLCSVGVKVVSLGVVSTPAVAFLVKKYKADAGIMISASHNPFEFNGIKIFQRDGFKLPDSLELEIENLIEHWDESGIKLSTKKIGYVEKRESLINDYIDYIKESADTELSGLSVAFDCSNGSASRSAYKIFSSLGADCFMLNDKPNGKNINENCGSVHLEGLIDFVKKNKLDVGIAFDGDADRCLAVDNEGRIVDGDIIMAVCAKYLLDNNILKNNAIVGTVMTNMGLIKFCTDNHINFVSANVGDRYVLEKMKENDYNFGGEQSGHVIFLDHSTTGDGQLTAVKLLSILKKSGLKLSDFLSLVKKYPQVMINVKVSQEGKKLLNKDIDVKNAIDKANKRLNVRNAFDMPFGRILVRASGTEPLIRVMVEGEKEDVIRKIATEVSEVIKSKLG